MEIADTIGVRFDNMVKSCKDDELGLFKDYDKILEETRRRIIDHNGKYILDIGCGTGNLCGELDEKFDVIGMDKNLQMLERIKEKYINIKCRCGSFLDNPFKEKYADVVVTTFAFHGLNYEEKKIAINNMMKYIKSDGKIIIVDYMFLNNKEREKCKQHYISCNREDLWNFINNKYYTIIEDLKSYVTKLNYTIKINHMLNFTWIVEITKTELRDNEKNNVNVPNFIK